MRRGTQPWWPQFAAERNAVLLDRLRWCALFTCLCGLGMGAIAGGLGASHLTQHLSASMAFAGVGLTLWGACTLPRVNRAATGVGVLFLVVLTLVITAVLARIPEEAPVVPATLISVMLGTTLLLPWGARRQAVVSGAGILAFGWSTTGAATDASTLCLILSTAAVAIVGARLVERLMIASFERSWVQEQLVTVARSLAGEVDVAALSAAIAEHGQRLVQTSAINVALHDPARHVFYVAVDTDPRTALVGLEVADDLDAVKRLVAHPVIVLPDDDPGNPISALIAQSGPRRVLYATMSQGDTVLGAISFIRDADVPFTAADRLVARAIGEQAALALRTARLVTDLRHAGELKTQFVSTMSHELRTPLNVILGFAEMLDDPAFSAEQRQLFVERIRGAGRDLLELIENTLAIGRVEAGRDTLELETVQLPTFWQELGERCDRMPRHGSVALDWQIDVPASSIRTDPRKLHMVVSNLVSNALKFTERGRVTVTLAVEGEDLVVAVADTGIGIAPEAHAHIFEMFRQADSSDSRRYGGTGLGLYIVKRFVEQLGGGIDLRSAPGAGSTFAVRIPVAPGGTPLRTAA